MACGTTLTRMDGGDPHQRLGPVTEPDPDPHPAGAATLAGAATPTGATTPPGAATPLGPSVDPVTGEVTFRVAADPSWTPQRVWFHMRPFGADPRFHHEGDQWVARIPRPPVQRLEYLLALRSDDDGGEALVPDPANPHRVRTVFGEHSVVEFPGYARPWWIGDDSIHQPDAPGQARSPQSHTPERLVVAASSAEAMQAHREGIASVRIASRPHDDRVLRSPAALGHPAARGADAMLVADASPDPEVVDARAGVVVAGRLHVPADSTAAEPLPLLVVHDGPEYDDLAQLGRYLTALARIDPVLRCRALLLQPVDRDRSYSASPAYSRALVEQLLPKVTDAVATRGPIVGMGASLGGLAILHAAVSHPGSFGALFCQSGSFFQPRTDAMESGYRFYDRIVRFVDAIDVDADRWRGLRVALTCGTGEDNLANNRTLARRLVRMGVPTELTENPDGHNYTGWRDALDPTLHSLLTTVWGSSD